MSSSDPRLARRTAHPGHRSFGPSIAAAIIIALLLALATGCGATNGDDGQSDGAGTDAGQGDTPAAGTSDQPVNVADASEQPDGTLVTVQGFLIEDSGTLYISDLIAESYPPQSGGPTLEVRGLELTQLDEVSEEGPVRWRNEPAIIVATVEAGRLVEAEPADN